MAKGRNAVWWIIGILVVLVVWGLIGAAVADDAGTSCKVGIGETFCWIWSQNALGDIEEGVDDVFENGEG